MTEKMKFPGSNFRSLLIITCILATFSLDGCAGFLPNSGPSAKDVVKSAGTELNPGQPNTAIQVIDVTGPVASKLLASRKKSLFSDTFGSGAPSEYVVGPGDTLDISIWEAPPGTLFGGVNIDVGGGASLPTAHGTNIPEQMVSSDGTITVPFANKVPAAGRTLKEIEAIITKRLQGIAHQPQVLVRQSRNTTCNVTVVGEVAASVRMPLTPRKERLLDALAAAGGTKQPVNKTMVQITRDNKVCSLPLDTIIRDPSQNIFMKPGDVITAYYQPNSFTVLGAMGKNDEVNFEAQGISLVQALARAGGLNDNRANSTGVFIFRLEPSDALEWPHYPTLVTPEGKVPVIYRADLSDPATFFAAQSFPIMDKDLLYVSNATAAELQKFLTMVMSVTYPVLTGITTFQ